MAHRSPACQIVLQRQQWRCSVHSSNIGGSIAVAAVTDDAVPAPIRQQRGRPLSLVPEFDAQQLLRDMQLDTTFADELSASMGKLPGIRQQGILQHGPQ
ncbi:hypothetical protein D9Q98_010263 [Chlorella vulgaris]|uniref:Uncharacterized protein n=1 Tax=Chlorella vulgaris TaxID=3077 RepID=A0A9D4TJV1_CHLVU|nr:hypothetical protein D9Q98_010263 [Chlorella vulgaris]